MEILFEVVKTTQTTNAYLDKLVELVRHEYRKHSIDLRAYERLINYISVAKLEVEQLEFNAKREADRKVGSLIDVRV